ncbi:MAG: hypothetical protein WAX89_03435 [Alphaproteobacteria bacterium]
MLRDADFERTDDDQLDAGDSPLTPNQMDWLATLSQALNPPKLETPEQQAALAAALAQEGPAPADVPEPLWEGSKGDIHVLWSGLMNGKNGMPERPPTALLSTLLTDSRKSSSRPDIEDNQLTAESFQNRLSNPELASKIEVGGGYIQGLWRSHCGQHVIKKVGIDDKGYMPYARACIEYPDNSFLPRIDAIVDTPDGIYIIMEPLVHLGELPQNSPYSQFYRNYKPAMALFRELFPHIQVDKFGTIIEYIKQNTKNTQDFKNWVGIINSLVHYTNAYVDLHYNNLMFRKLPDGTYEPVFTDPLAEGKPYDEISPRYTTPPKP